MITFNSDFFSKVISFDGCKHVYRKKTYRYVRIHLNQYCEMDYIATTSKHSNAKLLSLKTSPKTATFTLIP